MAPRTRRIARIRSSGANVALALVATAVAFAAAEVGARILYHPENLGTVIQFDRHLGWSLQPRSYLHSVDTIRDLEYTIRVNALGMRDREVDLEKASGQRRILFVGDSFSFGVGVEEGWRLSEFVGRALPGTEALNASVCGWGTDQELLQYERFAHKLRPDVVVLTFCASNDVLNNMLDHIYLGTTAKPRFVVRADSLVLEREELAKPRIAGRHRLRNWLRNSRLLLFAKRRIDAYRTEATDAEVVNHYHAGYGPQDAARPHSHWSVFEREYDAEFEEGWRVTEKVLERFASDCRRDGAELIVLAFPLELEVDDAWREQAIEHARIDGDKLDIEKPFERLETICRNIGVEYIHPLDEFRAAAERHRLYFEKDVHPNAFGHAAAARALLEELRLRHGIAYTVAARDLDYFPAPATPDVR